MTGRPRRFGLLCFVLLMLGNTALAGEPPREPRWSSVTPGGDKIIHLYIFWSKKCPHCQEALPFVQRLAHERHWLRVHALELTEHPEHVQQYVDMAAQLGGQARSVPAFFWCGRMVTGYDNEQGMGRFVLRQLQQCRQQMAQNRPSEAPAAPQAAQMPPLSVPLLGEVSLDGYSLSAYTVILAGLDAFNPCAFFVLLFLLSLLVHARNRGRMLAVGGIFVLFSGALYFLFMAAWLNVFLLIGQINLITLIAGAVAVMIALINIKDYFWFKKGVSLSIPDGARPGLFQRMRRTVNAEHMGAVIGAAMGLAAFANLYEFLCTAGFPMVFTRILTLHELPSSTYYLYLLLYNVIYIIPLAVIVVLFALTLGAKKLTEAQGRILKLLSGTMMLSLGLVLLLKPEWLNNAGIAVLLLAASLSASTIIATLDRRLTKKAEI